MRKITLLAFLTILLDGFDTTSIGFVVPTLAAQWQLPLSAFTPVFVATSLGAALGYALSGRLAVRWQRRDIVLASVLLFALGSCLSALAASVPVLALIRLLSGIGLGAALPAVVSLAVDGVASDRRESVTVGVTSGLSLGAALGGAIGGKLILSWGWGSVFLLGGIAPLLLLPALWFHLPADAPTSADTAAAQPHAARVSALLGAGLAPQTLLLWTFSFLIFMAVYALMFWVPSMLHRMGFDTSGVAFGSAALGIGGVVAALGLIPLSFRFHVRTVLVVSALVGALALAMGGTLAPASGVLLILIMVVGACLIAGTIGQVALAVSLYPPALRTAGIGWSAAIGRLGSVVGPGLMGAFVARDLPAPHWLLLPLAPVLLAALALWVAQRMASRTRSGHAQA